MLLKNGYVLSWGGSHSIYQLGRSVRKDISELTQLRYIKLPKADLKIVDITCGKQHCLALTEYNIVLSWGENYFGQVNILIYIK